MPEIGIDDLSSARRSFGVAPLVLRALADLLLYDLLAAVAGFPYIRTMVKRTPVKHGPVDQNTISRVCDAVDIASCFYCRQVRCMHRSFVAVRLLRSAGVSAQLVIGSRPIPFISHAWVEVDGCVVNDKPGYKRRLTEMDRI